MFVHNRLCKALQSIENVPCTHTHTHVPPLNFKHSYYEYSNTTIKWDGIHRQAFLYFSMHARKNTIILFVVHLLATDCIVTINVIILPYKIVYLDNKLVTATMHGCNYNVRIQWCLQYRQHSTHTHTHTYIHAHTYRYPFYFTYYYGC